MDSSFFIWDSVRVLRTEIAFDLGNERLEFLLPQLHTDGIGNQSCGDRADILKDLKTVLLERCAGLDDIDNAVGELEQGRKLVDRVATLL